MASGISNIIRYGLVRVLYQYFYNTRLRKRNRGKHLRLGFGCTVSGVTLGRHVYIGHHTMITNASIGDHSYVNAHAAIRDARIGKFCSIGPGVTIVVGSHPTGFVSSHPAFYANNKAFETYADRVYFEEYRSVEIGNDVWIGKDALIPGGVKIGDGAIIAARSVVTRDVPPYSIVGGVPAVLIRERFDPAISALIRNSKWWDKDEQWLRNNFRLFHSPQAFTDYFSEKQNPD